MLRVNGDRYEGEWRNGRMHGKGVKVMANGDVYNGTWENDKAEGNGVKVTERKSLKRQDTKRMLSPYVLYTLYVRTATCYRSFV